MTELGRPLTARSVVASTLLGVDPPRLPVQALVQVGELFGIREGTVRTALSRMVATGEAEADGGTYALVGALAERSARQTEARAGGTRRWDGTWELAVVTPARRPAADRASLRQALGALRLAEVREGVWARPSNLDPTRAPAARALAGQQCAWLAGARPTEPGPFLTGFDLPGWSSTATRLLDLLAGASPALEEGDQDALRHGFVLDAAVIRHLTADPLLPAELLPVDWPGEELRAAGAAFDRAWNRTWRAWRRSRGW